MHNIDTINTLSCGHCEYHIESSKIMDIHHRTFHNKVKNIIVISVVVMYHIRHRKIVHEVVKFPCRQCNCNYQATSKEHLTRHKSAVHEGVKYSCKHCNHQATTKNSLARHKREVHEGLKRTSKNDDNQK